MSGQPRPSLRRPPSPPDEPPRLRVLNLTRFTAIQAPHPLEWLTDNGSVYTAKESRDFAMAINLVPCFTPVQSPESNGISESFVKTFKRDYVRIHPLPHALTALQQDRRMVRGQPSTFRAPHRCSSALGHQPAPTIQQVGSNAAPSRTRETALERSRGAGIGNEAAAQLS
jgi:transposase InsO family protein